MQSIEYALSQFFNVVSARWLSTLVASSIAACTMAGLIAIIGRIQIALRTRHPHTKDGHNAVGISKLP
jgi:hypothetical protein